MYTEHAVDDRLLEPWRYLMDVPGKDVRGSLIDAFQMWLHIPTDKISTIKSIITQLHTASLLIDDIEDNSLLRRGVPVAHSIYGVPSTINTSNYVYFLAMEKCFCLHNEKAMGVFCLELLNLHRGQGQDILWRESNTCPTEEEYTQMVLDKTGGLFRLAVGLMQALSENTTNYSTLVNKMALYFQIRDDYVNLNSTTYMLSKSFCEDITEGKFSFPLIHGIRAQPRDKRLLNILKQHTDNAEVKTHAVEFLRAQGSFDYTIKTLSRLMGEVDAEIERLGGHTMLSHLMHALHSQLDSSSSGAPPITTTTTTTTAAASSTTTTSGVAAAAFVTSTLPTTTAAVPVAPQETKGGSNSSYNSIGAHALETTTTSTTTTKTEVVGAIPLGLLPPGINLVNLSSESSESLSGLYPPSLAPTLSTSSSTHSSYSNGSNNNVVTTSSKAVVENTSVTTSPNVTATTIATPMVRSPSGESILSTTRLPIDLL